jgi:uncharacterized protein
MGRLTIQTKQIGTVSKALLLIGTLVVFQALISGFSKATALSKSSALIEADHCELLLRLADAINAGFSQMLSSQSGSPYTSRHDELSNEACHQLEQVAQKDGNNALVLSKLIITSAQLGKNTQAELDRLSLLDSENAKELAPILKTLYGKSNSAGLDLSSFKARLEKSVTPGWYLNNALLKLYKVSGNEREYKILSLKLDQDNRAFFIRLSCTVVFGCLCAFLGCIVILVQLFNLARTRLSSEELNEVVAPVDYGWIKVYAVFIAWLATQIFMGMLLQPLTGKLKIGVLDSMTMACTIAIVYLISNGPVLLYIYFFALRPSQVKLLDGIKLRTKVGKLGIGGMVFSGVLAWLAAIPVVAISYIIASKFLGSHGSNNPIIAVVMEAAHSTNFSAVLLFYITLSVLAPICEESLFRGFFYSFLRRRMGMVAAMLISAGLFSFLHMDVGGILPLFCLGCIFATLFERTKSILPSIIAHGLWNGSTFTLVLLLFGN